LRQLYWRDFYTYIVFHFPHVIGNSFDKKHEIIFWNKEGKGLDEWKNGITGVPIVDAGMRELNETGYMHNRVRLIVGSFLTKDLHIPWWFGEQYFATKLIDYDISVNNGNWQWVGGTGVDPVPYFRIFNPWLQAKKFDPDAVYIKKWVPELKDLPAGEIHSLFKTTMSENINYPKPIVDHTEEMRKVKMKYR
jgi:deoxyribodipyrimidine photo-lyase